VTKSAFGEAVSEKKIFRNRPHQKQELPMAAMFVNESGRLQQIL
jgi:hypothetical protein